MRWENLSLGELASQKRLYQPTKYLFKYQIKTIQDIAQLNKSYDVGSVDPVTNQGREYCFKIDFYHTFRHTLFFMKIANNLQCVYIIIIYTLCRAIKSPPCSIHPGSYSVFSLISISISLDLFKSL